MFMVVRDAVYSAGVNYTYSFTYRSLGEIGFDKRKKIRKLTSFLTSVCTHKGLKSV